MVTVQGYMNSPAQTMPFDINSNILHRGHERTIHWPSAKPVPLQKEIQLLNTGTLLRRGEFGPLQGSRALEVELECGDLGLTYHQALSIRKQLIMRKTLKGSWKLKDDSTMDKIKKKFECQQKSLKEISQEYDLPPVSIFRAIVAPRVLDAYPQFTCLNTQRPAGRIVQSIINEDDPVNVNSFLSEWELKQLQNAKDNDVVGYNDSNCAAGEEWEKTIYNFLDEHDVKYLTENTMKLHYGDETKGTPDCLLLDDLYINGKQIGWIEFKSFYASGLKENSYFTKKSICKQVEKYTREFGKSGAVIMKNGFSGRISERYPETLFLDGGPLYATSEYY